MRRFLCAIAVLTLGASYARAQYPYQPQQFNPQQFQPPQFFPPQSNPNQIVNVQGQTNWYMDPATGQWKQHSQTDITHDSFNSPGRNTMVPGTLQNYTYTDASGRLVQGTRWLGQDGLWHGDHAETSQDASGNTTVVNQHRYARNPMAGGASNQPRTSATRPPAQPQYRPQYTQPAQTQSRPQYSPPQQARPTFAQPVQNRPRYIPR